MITIRHANERGHANHGWLDSFHTFSFADYFDPNHMGYSVLRVINDDTVAPGAGFGTHGHRDMEIISYVLEGALKHQDSMGNGSVIRPGDVQRMSAGTGITHSEFNGSDREPVHFLQIWILPNQRGHTPSYEQKHFPENEREGRWRLLVSPDGREESLRMNQDAYLFGTRLDSEEQVDYTPAIGRKLYVHVATGHIQLAGQTLQGGDGAFIADEAAIAVIAKAASEILLFDLP
ncbi:MAG: pirin family protein [Gammaproteobacteria bacterium]|nr:pirin family protein [Gammaproteobacteria bacterium]